MTIQEKHIHLSRTGTPLGSTGSGQRTDAPAVLESETVCPCAGGSISEFSSGRKTCWEDEWRWVACWSAPCWLAVCYLGSSSRQPEQRKRISAVQTEYNEKIDALKRDIRKLEDDERRELNKILTDAQREELKKIAVSKALNEPPKDEIKPKEQKKPGDK